MNPTDCTIDEEIDESLTLEDLLYICGHSALGLSIREAIEIDPDYERREKWKDYYGRF